MEKRVVSMEEEQGLVNTILDYALEHKFTKGNIADAVNKAMDYMDKNALLGETLSGRTEPLRHN